MSIFSCQKYTNGSEESDGKVFPSKALILANIALFSFPIVTCLPIKDEESDVQAGVKELHLTKEKETQTKNSTKSVTWDILFDDDDLSTITDLSYQNDDDDLFSGQKTTQWEKYQQIFDEFMLD
tara:strand:- start:1874 stop:2245 length:372 start_codon:yes stop_codon:yes gene_type:complete